MKLILRRYWWVVLAAVVPGGAMLVNHTLVLTNSQRDLLAIGCVLVPAVVAVLVVRTINKTFVDAERSRRSRENLQQALKERAR